MSTKTQRTITLTASLLVMGGVGYYVSRPQDTSTVSQPIEGKNITQDRHTTLPANKPLHRAPAKRSSYHKEEHLPDTALQNERILTFKNDADYQKFLASLKARGLLLLGRSDKLLAVRVGTNRDSNLNDIDGAEMGYNYMVSIPTPPQADAQEGATGFGMNALSWLGVEGDNSAWGKGITVAVLDTGVNEHIALQGNITQILLTDLAEGSKQLGHGTAVASIISGDHRLAPGVAPASDILAIRIADETGSSNSFTMAEGIMQAVDAGASIINISMGSYGDSNAVANAVRYAQEQGAVIVASTGNEGRETIAYPAAYEGVISVGAVEQHGDHLDFSNSGETLSVVAPGYQVNAAWGTEQLTSFSGTSASAPFVSGAIAATLSEKPNMTAQQAADLVVKLSNDGGYPGNDPYYGNGTLDLGRIMDYGTTGIYDAAITSQVLIMPQTDTALPEAWVTVQNQGTETLINSPVSIKTANRTQNLNISSLAPGQIQTFRIPVVLPYTDEAVTITSSVQTNQADKDTSNNSRSDSFTRE